MKLSSVNALIAETYYVVKVHHVETGDFEEIELNYLGDHAELNKAVLRRFEIEEAKNKVVSITTENGLICVRVDVWGDISKNAAGKYVRDWYVARYPDDEIGAMIKEGLTWEDLMKAVPLGGGFYGVLGVGDSLIRERIFNVLAALFANGDYMRIYHLWLHGEDKKSA